MTGCAGRRAAQTEGWWRPGMVVGVWSVRVRHVLWLLLLWMVCALHLLYLFASYAGAPGGSGVGGGGGGGGVSTTQEELLFSPHIQDGNSLRSPHRRRITFGETSVEGGRLQEDKGYVIRRYVVEEEAGLSAGEPRALESDSAIGNYYHDKDLQESSFHQSHPQPLEGQQLRHLADIGSLLYRENTGGSHDRLRPDENPGALSSSKESAKLDAAARTVSKQDQLLRNSKGKMNILDSKNKVLNTRIYKSTHDDIDNIQGGRVLSKGTPSSSSSSSSTRAEPSWIVCPSVVAPSWATERMLREEEVENERGGESQERSEDEEADKGWQTVRPGQSYVFSAYHDPRPLILGGTAGDGAVRVIGLTDTHVDGAPQFCQLWYTTPTGGGRGRRGRGARGTPATTTPAAANAAFTTTAPAHSSSSLSGKNLPSPSSRRRRNSIGGQYEQLSAPHQQQPTTSSSKASSSSPFSSAQEENIHHQGAGGGGRFTVLKSNRTFGKHSLRLVVVPAISDIVPETHGLRFAPFIYTCKLTTSQIPVAVSMTHARCDTPLNFLRIHKPAVHPLQEPEINDNIRNNNLRYHFRRQPQNYTVCVTPFNFNYNNVHQLVEKVEVDSIMGANRFIFYNYSSGPGVASYLQSYIDEGVAEVIQWRLPVRVDTWPPSSEVDVHYFAQLAALNDCLYRSMFTSRMVVFTDMDELIVPKKHNRWRDMVTFLNHKGQGSAGTFIFQNSFFRTEWPDDAVAAQRLNSSSSSVSASDALRIMSLTKTRREQYVYPWGMRSKYICDPRKVEMVGVHNIWRFINDSFSELDVPPDVGLLHHYRSWNKPEVENSVLDTSMHAYFDIIVSRVRERHAKVNSRHNNKNYNGNNDNNNKHTPGKNYSEYARLKRSSSR